MFLKLRLNNQHTKFIFLPCILAHSISGCAHSSSIKIISDENLIVQSAEDKNTLSQTSLLKAKEVTEISSDTVILSAQGKIPIYLVQANRSKTSEQEPIKISLKPIEEWKPAQTDHFITQKMDALYIQLFDVLQDARNKKPDTALLKIKKIIDAYPKLASAYYVKAQIEAMMGEINQAIASLDLAVGLRPEFQDAILLKQKLKGGKRL